MDTQVEELIDRIKKDGVAAAETSASEKISQAEKEAAKIISDAKIEADNILKKAKEESSRFEKASEDAIKQAARNILISFRDGITNELSALINSEVDSSYSKDILSKLIPEVVKEWSKSSDASEISVLLNEKQLFEVEASLKASLKSEIEKGMTIKTNDSINSGFRISVNNGAAFYDYSAEAVAELFSSYLNPKVSALMKEAAK